MIEIEGIKFDTPDAVAELLRVVSVERDELKSQLAEYKYTPQAYGEMWERTKEAVGENDKLRTENDRLRIACAEYRKNSTAWEKKYTALTENATPLSARVYKLVAHQSSPDDLKIVDEVKALEMLAKMRPMKDVDQEEEIKALKDKVKALEEQLLQMHEGLTITEQEVIGLKESYMFAERAGKRMNDNLRYMEKELSKTEEEIKKLKQAIQNTLDTGMDRYIREATAVLE